MGEEKERKGGERKKEEGAGTDERPGKSGRGERNMVPAFGGRPLSLRPGFVKLLFQFER